MQPSRLPTSPTEVEPEKLWNTRTVNSVTVSRSDMPLHKQRWIRTTTRLPSLFAGKVCYRPLPIGIRTLTVTALLATTR